MELDAVVNEVTLTVLAAVGVILAYIARQIIQGDQRPAKHLPSDTTVDLTPVLERIDQLERGQAQRSDSMFRQLTQQIHDDCHGEIAKTAERAEAAAKEARDALHRIEKDVSVIRDRGDRHH